MQQLNTTIEELIIDKEYLNIKNKELLEDKNRLTKELSLKNENSTITPSHQVSPTDSELSNEIKLLLEEIAQQYPRVQLTFQEIVDILNVYPDGNIPPDAIINRLSDSSLIADYHIIRNILYKNDFIDKKNDFKLTLKGYKAFKELKKKHSSINNSKY